MKPNLILFICCFIGATLSACAQVPQDTGYAKLVSLLATRNLTALQRELDTSHVMLTPAQRLTFAAFLQSAFNKRKQAISSLDSLLRYYPSDIDSASLSELYLLRAQTHFREFHYLESANDYENLATKFSQHLDSTSIKNFADNALVNSSLSNIPPQQTTVYADTRVKWKESTLGFIQVKMRAHNKNINAILDPFSQMSTVTKEVADRLKMKRTSAKVLRYIRPSGGPVIFGIAVMDSLYIGDVLIENVVFQVQADDGLRSLVDLSEMHMVLGMPVIEQLGELHLYNDGSLIIPRLKTHSTLHNLAIDRNYLAAILNTGDNDYFPFLLNFATKHSVLFAPYYQHYPAVVTNEGKKAKSYSFNDNHVERTGAKRLPFFEFSIGDKKRSLPNVEVYTKAYLPIPGYFGVLGNDFFNAFQGVLLNFEDMFIEGLPHE
jgi:hypothetical protein